MQILTSKQDFLVKFFTPYIFLALFTWVNYLLNSFINLEMFLALLWVIFIWNIFLWIYFVSKYKTLKIEKISLSKIMLIIFWILSFFILCFLIFMSYNSWVLYLK